MQHKSDVLSRILVAFGTAVGLSTVVGSAAGNRLDEQVPANLTAWAAPSHTLLSDGRTLVLGSGTQSAQPDAYVINPDKQTVQLLAPPSVARTHHTATVLPNGRVLVWGGLDTNGHLAPDGLWFDPRTDTFSETTNIALLPRAGHSATLLTDGRLLIVGGWNPKFGALSEAELWDYRTNQSELLKGELTPPLVGHSATLLGDGRVLILGGYDADGRRFTDAALYDPDHVAFVNIDSMAGALLAATGESTDTPAIGGSTPRSELETLKPGGLIGLRFTVPMDVRTFGGAVTLVGQEGTVALTAISAEGGRLLFVQPTNELLPGSRYTLFVDGARSARDILLPFTAISFATAVLTHSASDGTLDTNLTSGADGASDPSSADNSHLPNSTSAPAPQQVARDAVTHEQRLSTGAGGPQLRPTCASTTEKTHFCRSDWSAAEGFWRPAESNKGGRWRINGNSPLLPDARLLKERSIQEGVTALYGQVFRIDDQPVANVEVSIGDIRTRTDANGVFVLLDAPPGHQTLLVDGTTASTGDIEYGDFVVGVDVRADKKNAVPHLLYLPRIHPRDKVTLPSPTLHDTVITHPEMPGVEIHIPAGIVFKDRKGRAVTDFAVVPMPVDRAPFPGPTNFPIYFVFEPGGMVIEALSPDARSGIKIVYPNMTGAAPGTAAELSVYDPIDGWRIYGQGQVSSDGSQVVPDTEAGLHLVMGASYGISDNMPPPSTAPAPCATCPCSSGVGVGPGGPMVPAGGQGPLACTDDPVDLSTGLFIHRTTDISVADLLPLNIVRTYRQGDTLVRSFGIGTTFNYGPYLYTASGDPHSYPTFDVVLPEGSPITYTLVSGTLDFPDATFKPVGPAGIFEGSEIRFEHSDLSLFASYSFVLERRDGFQYVFDAFYNPNRLMGMRDRFGNEIRLTYNSGLPVRVSSPSGRYLDLTYDGQNRIQQIMDNTGRTVLYHYTSPAASGLLDTVTYPDTTTEQYTYDPTTQSMLTVVDRRTNTQVTNTYDSNNRVFHQTLADGALYTVTYTPTAGSPFVAAAHVVEPRGNQRDVKFDSFGYPAIDTRAVGTAIQQVTTYERDALERITAIVDPLSRRTEYTYDTAGNRNSVTYLAGTPDAVGYSMTYTPDFNQIHVITDPLGHSTTFDYTNGCLTKVTDALTHHIDVACNLAGQPTMVTDALGHPTTYSYLVYDVNTVTDALNRTVTYTTDSLGRIVAVRDPLGNSSRFEYDVNDRLKTMTDALSHQTQLQYDGNGNLASVQDPNTGLTQFGYDVRNRENSRTDALTNGESWTYDGMGNLLTYTDRKGQLTQYNVIAYDALNRLQQINYADGSTTALTWDAGDRATTIADSLSGTLTWAYDGLDRLLSEQSPQGTVSYTYDPASRRQTMTVASQTQIQYTFDNADRLTDITQGSANVHIDYDYANRRSKLTLPNKTHTIYTFDNADELTNLAYTNATNATLGSVSYTYDVAGRRITQTGGFLTDLLPTSTTADGVFNLNNEQTGFNGATIGYDANGDPSVNHATIPATSYTFDARHRLIAMVRSGTTIASFHYDAIGRRTSNTVGSTTTSFLYDGWNPVQEAQGASRTPILAGLDVDERFVRTNASGGQYFLVDGQGSTLALTDNNGSLVQTYAYEPYGEVTTTGSSDNSYQYTGRQNDGTGLYYYRARYYSPALKRFISEDPLGLAAGLNSYAYVEENPLSNTDPSGLEGIGPWTFAPGPDRDNYYRSLKICDGYGDRYLNWVVEHEINVGPYALAMAGGLWPKSWSPATNFRPPLLGSSNPLTSVPRAFGMPGGGSAAMRGGAAGVGLVTVFIGTYNLTIFTEGLLYAIPGGDCSCSH